MNSTSNSTSNASASDTPCVLPSNTTNATFETNGTCLLPPPPAPPPPAAWIDNLDPTRFGLLIGIILCSAGIVLLLMCYIGNCVASVHKGRREAAASRRAQVQDSSNPEDRNSDANAAASAILDFSPERGRSWSAHLEDGRSVRLQRVERSSTSNGSAPLVEVPEDGGGVVFFNDGGQEFPARPPSTPASVQHGASRPTSRHVDRAQDSGRL